MKNRELILRGLLLLLAAFIFITIVMVIRNFNSGSKKKEIKVGGIFIGECDDKGWNESNYTGLLEACERLDCTLEIQQNVPEKNSDLRNAVNNLVNSGCAVIFMTSNGYGKYADSIADDYPRVAFYSISGEGNAENCTSYFARIYQARYLTGIVAAGESKTGKLGIVSAMPSSYTNRTINAFALGAQKANPNVKVFVYFTGSWVDEDEEKSAVKLLASKGVDVVTYHQDKPYVIDEAEELGIYSIGYESVYEEYSDKFLTSTVIKWDVLYEKVLGDYIKGKADLSNDYWLGISDEVVSLFPYSDLVDEDTRALVETEKARIETWNDVFSGEIYDNEGNLKCGKDEAISDDELFNGMDWYVDGVEVYE